MINLADDDLRRVDLFVVDVCLGNVQDSILFGKLGGESVGILQKPFTPQILVATIGEMIGAGRVERANSA